MILPDNKNREDAMHIDQLRSHLPDETACRIFFEELIWAAGRRCPRCKSSQANEIKSRNGLYQCSQCKKQFTVTAHTPFHGTKLPLWTWIKAMYFILTSSKGISSVVLGRLVGVSQKTAWKMGHAIRKMMETEFFDTKVLKGIVEIDEKFIGGKPRFETGSVHKRGKGTSKSQVLIATERQGPAYCHVIESDRADEIQPVLDFLVDSHSHLMSDESKTHMKIGRCFSEHSSVNHSKKQYSKGDIHSNTAESFASILERAKLGVFHYMSQEHLPRYLNEASFRWTNRVGKKTTTKSGKIKIRWSPLPFLKMAGVLLANAAGQRLKRSENGGLVEMIRPYDQQCASQWAPEFGL